MISKIDEKTWNDLKAEMDSGLQTVDPSAKIHDKQGEVEVAFEGKAVRLKNHTRAQ